MTYLDSFKLYLTDICSRVWEIKDTERQAIFHTQTFMYCIICEERKQITNIFTLWIKSL